MTMYDVGRVKCFEGIANLKDLMKDVTASSCPPTLRLAIAYQSTSIRLGIAV